MVEPEAPADHREHRFELIETLVLAAAAVLTAWAAFQSTKWSGVQADSYSRAAAARVQSTQAENLAGQYRILDTEMFTAWVSAIGAETRWGNPPRLDADGVYQPDPAIESGFLFERFRDEFKPIVGEWLTTNPLTNPDAPATPFVLPDYGRADRAVAEDLSRRAEHFADQAQEANQNGDDYVLMTILFATVLVLVGLGSKMNTDMARTVLVGMAVSLLVVAAGVVLWFPKEV